MMLPDWEVRPVSIAYSSSPIKVGDLLSTHQTEQIIVPTFQRGYMWKKKHVEDFWEDIEKQRGKPKGIDPHFFGPIVTLTNSSKGEIYLLDGQQRIATTTILLAVIRDIAREIGGKHGFQAANDLAAKVQLRFIYDEDKGYSLQIGETDHVYFRNTIQSDPPTNSKATNLTHRNIKSARAILYGKVISVTGEIQSLDPIQAVSTLKDIRDTTVGEFVMARIPVTSEEAAFKIFTTLNDRGLRLSPPDLLLSFLMEKASPDDRKDVRAMWTEMIQKMGTHDIQDFLRAMWVSRYGDLKKDDLFTALKGHLEKHLIASIDFAKMCNTECDDYIHLVTADDTELPEESLRCVRAITRELNIKSAAPLLLSSYLALQTSDFVKIAKYILVFVTRYSIIGNKDSSGMEGMLFKLAREVRAVNGKNDMVASKKAAEHAKSLLLANSPDDATIKNLVIKENTTLDSSEARYVMKRLANYLQDKENQTQVGDTNLEHVYPQNPEENEWGGTENQEKMEPLTWHIGNMTIFGKRANRKNANKEYHLKQPRYAASPVKMTSGIAKWYTKWDEESIFHRATFLAQMIVEVWNFNDPSRV